MTETRTGPSERETPPDAAAGGELPADEDIDLSDIPETDFRYAERGKAYERATGRPLPPDVRRLNRANATIRLLRATMEGIVTLADAERAREPLSVEAGEIARVARAVLWETAGEVERHRRELAGEKPVGSPVQRTASPARAAGN